MEKLSLGQTIAKERKNLDLTQEQLAEKLGVSSQAVSKWENDVTCPDITLLPLIARVFGMSIDRLMGEVSLEEEKQLLNITTKTKSNLLVKIRVLSADGDKVSVNVPYAVIKIAATTGSSIASINGLKGVDLAEIFTLIESGMLGKIVEVDSADGDHIEITVE